MEWFKHLTGSHDDPDISDAWDKFGDAAISVFWITLEIYGKEFRHTKKNGFLTLNKRFWERKVRKEFQNFEPIWRFLRQRKVLTYRDNGDTLSIAIPKFLKLSSNWTQYGRQEPIQAPLKGPTQAPKKNRDVEVETREEETREEETREEETKKKKEKISSEPKKPVLSITFDFERKIWFNIDPKEIARWSEIYPSVEIELEIKRAGEWLLSNPHKRKKNYRRFLTNWLARKQEKGGNKNVPRTDRPPLDPIDRRLWDAEKRLRGDTSQTSD